ncbi:MAG: phosphoribosylaminoimidazolesuccinocarboxamide synthase, partial [Phycisphaerales bacterium]|nr:phosphoribosylaminoimidazolesuccinocarboxamide synthase [Phycisphaerae bacterium]NNM27413.1 phosphoribosylaminoimidazolesuccinocarboxamide synthase [Phycisphaerales bacterium]
MTGLKPCPSGGPTAVYETHLPLPGRRQGKVRDIYRLPASGGQPASVLFVASDRISAFDVVLPDPIPGKGVLLTGIATQWFDFIRARGIIADHLRSTDPADVPGLSTEEQDQIRGRMMLGRAAEVIPIEFVVRGYLAGSGWVEYQRDQSVCGVSLPAGLQQCSELPEPIFTPATKAEVGHDENIDFDRASDIAGRDVMTRLRDVSLRLYREAAAHAREKGIILADTKLEFGYALDDDGRRTDEIILIDEVFTPDSSRFWPAEEYAAGRDQDSFDKQYVRNYLLKLVKAGTWDKTPPGPPLPDEITGNTAKRYAEAQRRLFG